MVVIKRILWVPTPPKSVGIKRNERGDKAFRYKGLGVIFGGGSRYYQDKGMTSMYK